MKIKVCCISDLHGRLPKELPEHDLLLIAGDICPLENHHVNFQRQWLNSEFNNWWESINSPIGLGCWGNHDLIAEDNLHDSRWVSNNKDRMLFISNLLYLQNILSLNILLSPYQSPFGIGWAFNKAEVDMARICDQVPDNIDIIVSHGPALGYGDRAKRFNGQGYEDTGYQCMVDLIDRVKPKLFVCGHIHSGFGVYNRGETVIVNASICNEKYKPVNKPIVVEINV